MFILLGVVLFAALAFIISRGMRNSTTTAMSQRQAELAAVDVISFAQRLERAISKVQLKGVSENDLSFDSEAVTGYGHTPAEPDNGKIFSPAGGSVSWQDAPASVNDGSPWHFTGHSCVPDVGNGGTGCGGNAVNDEELLAVLPNINAVVCAAIDKKLGMDAIPQNTGGAYSTTKFTGSFADGSEIILDNSHNAACYEQVGNYHFYYVLIAR
jgi:hypothetical protein